MTDRIRVTADELKLQWFRPEATGMIDDHQAGVRIVRLEDGTEYDCPLDELVP